MVQLNKNIDLYKERAWRVITYNAHLSENGSTGLYTLSTGSDVRYLTFSTLLSCDEFVNMAIPYNEYRIHKAVFTSLPPTRTDRIPYLYVNVEPSNVAANPNNVRLCASDTARIFSPRSLQRKEQFIKILTINYIQQIHLMIMMLLDTLEQSTGVMNILEQQVYLQR